MKEAPVMRPRSPSWMARVLRHLSGHDRLPARQTCTASIRILILADAKGATQAISFLRPFDEAIRSGTADVKLLDEKEVAVQTPSSVVTLFREFQPTSLILSRYAGGAEAAFIDEARRAAIPVIYHIDDNLFAVPSSLGMAKFTRYNDPKRLSDLRRAMESADLIYASTTELGHQVSKLLPGRPIFPGKIYCAHAPLVDGSSGKNGPLTIGYMGTSGHADDLAGIVPSIASLLDSVPGSRFETFGTIKPPDEFRQFGSRIRHHEPRSNYDEFLIALASLGWHVGLAPLTDNAFNRCKADTKWVEYTAAGIAVAATDLPVYQGACAEGSGLLVSPGGWGEALRRLSGDAAMRRDMVDRAQRRLVEEYSAQRLRTQLDQVFRMAREKAGTAIL